MPLKSLALSRQHPVDPMAVTWVEHYDSLLAEVLAGADARTLYPRLLGLFDLIAAGSPLGPARDLLLAQRAQVRRAARGADHGLVTGNLLFLHDWLSRTLTPVRRARAA